MKTMTYILISLSIIFAHLFACDTGYTEITIDNVADCYYDSDLEVLRKFAENSDADSLDNFNLINDTEGLWTSSPTFVNGRITDLFCYQCDIKGEIPSDIGYLTELNQLFLYAPDSLTGSIPSSIGSPGSQLTSITITDSQIDGTIPSSIGTLSLTLLDLHGNALTGLIPDSICDLEDVSSINLSENTLCEPYPDTCSNINTSNQTQTVRCTCLEGKLPVDGENCYSETDLDVLSSFASTNSEWWSTDYTDVISMGDQSWVGGKLTFWNCDSCRLGGSNADSILYEIINLTDITSLDLSNNALFGSIPSDISSLALTTLNLSNNALSGSIPSDIGSLALDTLNLSNNTLTGITPEDICDYFVLNTSYYNFDSNLLCPPYPECSNTISQNQLPAIDNLLTTFYRDADNDGNGDPEAACPEQFCEDYPPPIGDDCEGYIADDNPDDTNDACLEGQVRDECGVCGGSGVNNIYDCCPINNNGYDDGTGPNGEEPDECGVCGGDDTVCADCAGVPNGDKVVDNCGTCDAIVSNDCEQDCAGTWGGSLVEDGCGVCDGLNTNCSGGYNADTCPSMDQCNTCFGTNECLAQLTSYEPGSNPIDINTSTIRLHFSVPVDFLGNIATDGIEIESTYGTAPTFSTAVDQDSILTLTLDKPLISSDQVIITLNPCKIKNTMEPKLCLDADKNNLADEIGSSDEYIEIPMTVKLLGDYNSDNDVNQYDLDILVEKWATDDFSYELGPWTGAEAPYLQPISFSYDSDYNIHDLTGFVLMWNYADGLQRGSRREAELKSTIDFIPEYYFGNNRMTLNLEKFSGDIKRIWLQLDAINSNIELDNAVNSSQFDISLHGAHAEYRLYNWTLASFSKLKNKKIDLFNIIHRNESNDQNLKLVYEIVGFNEKISVGELNLVYGSTPEKIIISSPYPNPFNPVTTITYSIAQKSNILVEIYNIQGRLIDKTVTDNTEMGSYTFTWDGTNQPSGIYLIRMKINDTIKNYRTILIK